MLLALLAALPPILARYPQMTDYPAHLARWYVMLDRGENPVLAQYYGFRWAWSGNLGVDLLIQPLAHLIGLEAAGRVIVVLIPALTGLALIDVERALRGRAGPGSVLAMATIWSPALLMGFLNFALSLALALFALALWIRTAGWHWRSAVFVPIGLVIWLCHQSGWGVLGVLVFAYEWRTRRKLFAAALATWPLWPPFVPSLLAGAQAAGSFNYGPLWWRVKWIEWRTVLRDRVQWLDYASAAVIFAAPFVALVFRRVDGRVGVAALLTGLLAIAIPRHLGGGDYADYRLVSVAAMLGALALDLPTRAWVMALASVPFLARIAVTSAAWNAHSHEVSRMLQGLDHVPRGAVVAAAVREPLGEWGTALYGHVADYATVRRDALTNAHFAIPGVHMLQIRAPGWTFTDPSQRFMVRGQDPVDLADFAPARQAQYLWYFGSVPPSRLPAGAVVIHRTPGSLLAKLPR